jgi:alginate O-acetyltransferase complex protein AlgI
MTTMVLGGLWHGAGWNFIIWGSLHGAGLVSHKLWLSRRSEAQPPAPSFLGQTVSRLLTLGLVVGGWIFFRARTFHDAATFLGRILTWHNTGTRLLSPQILAALAAVILIHLLVPKDYNWAVEIPRHTVPVRILAYTSLVVALALFAATEGAPFIYFQF